MLLSLYIAAGPSKIKRVGAVVLLAKLGGATGPIYLFYTTCRSLNGRFVPALIASFLTSCKALRERKRSRSQELLPKYIEQEAKQGPSSQSAERTGSGLQACPNSKELRGLGVRAQVRVPGMGFFFLVLCCEGFLNPASLTQRDVSSCTRSG